MNTRLFKSGDKVQLKTGGPVMEVVQYVLRTNFLYPQHINTEHVECEYYNWMERNWKKEAFHQDNLVKVDNTRPAWIDNLIKIFEARPAPLLN